MQLVFRIVGSQSGGHSERPRGWLDWHLEVEVNNLGLDLVELGASGGRERGGPLLRQVDPLQVTSSIGIMRDRVLPVAAGHVELELPDDGVLVVIHH